MIRKETRSNSLHPDGRTTTWTYDTAGREATTAVDGALIAAIERDPTRRRVVITDHCRATGLRHHRQPQRVGVGVGVGVGVRRRWAASPRNHPHRGPNV
ncbi:hypothetical protein [Paenarthrobacter sp. AMU7]|uniref:RHS repeat protein n=1 Tax=Paenarthrobacter sp. AMU7 TaxID=3162492 RepID=A0AB39YUY2_9MICC